MTAAFSPHIAGVVGIVTLAIWLHLFVGRGWFWRVNRFYADREKEAALENSPSVIAIVPARNEAATVAQVVTSLASQDYPGEFSVVIVDDHSDDDTAELAQRAATEGNATERVQVVAAPLLPNGWTGKVWAMNSGVSATAQKPPTFYWFTDADIVHAPDTLRCLVLRAQRDRLDLASLMVLLHAKALPERALIPAFLYFFLMLYPPQWTADEELNTAGAAGGCVLLRHEALQRIGGLTAIRNEVIDDCALARKIKQSGARVWMGLTRKSTSLRVYGTFTEIRDLIARTAFTQLRYSALLLVGTLAGMLLTYIAPVALLFTNDPIARILGVAAWLFMSLSFLPTTRFYACSPLWAPLLPLGALFYTYATLLSALRYWRGRGAQWKGRAQAARNA